MKVTKKCPVTNGIPTRMTRRSFGQMCLAYRKRKVRKPTGMGRHHEITAKDYDRLPCDSCRRGHAVEHGPSNHWSPPPEVDVIKVKEIQEIRERYMQCHH